MPRFRVGRGTPSPSTCWNVSTVLQDPHKKISAAIFKRSLIVSELARRQVNPIAKLCFAGVFKQLPNIRWLVGHAGGAIPYLMERMDSGWRDFAECRVNIDEPPSFYLKKLYYDTVTFSPHNLRMLRDIVGADHMAMGSDYPHLLGSIEKAVSSIEGMDFSAAEKGLIQSGTALSIMNNVPQTARR